MLRVEALRDHAAKLQELARKETSPVIRTRLWAMADQCEEVIKMIERSLTDPPKKPDGA